MTFWEGKETPLAGAVAVNRSPYYVLILRLFMVCLCTLLLQVFEKFTKESTSLLDELALINNGSDKGNEQEKERWVELSGEGCPCCRLRLKRTAVNETLLRTATHS